MKLSIPPVSRTATVAMAFVLGACTRSEGIPTSLQASAADASVGSETADATATPDGAALVCLPETRGYAPLVDAPPRPAARACTDAEVSALVRDCLESADRWFDPACSGHTDACAGCMLSKGTDKAWGAVILLEEGDSTGFVPNQSGCIDLATGIPGCGTRITGFSDCSTFACTSDRCPSADDRTACVDRAAREGACAAFAPDAACRAAYTSRARACTSGGKAGFLAAMKAFCQAP